MPGEKHKKPHSERSPGEPLRDEKSPKKHKKKKSDNEKKRKRKHEIDELKKVQDPKAQPDDGAGDVVDIDSTEKKKKFGDVNIEISRDENVNEPSLTKSVEKRKKKKKKKERKTDDVSDQPSDEKQINSNAEEVDAIEKNDQADSEGPTGILKEAEPSKVEKKRKKKKKDRKGASSTSERDETELKIVEEGVSNAKKELQSESAVKSGDGPGGENRADEEMVGKDLVHKPEVEKSKHIKPPADVASKQKIKKRKREEQKSDSSEQQPVNDADREALEPKEEHLPQKRAKRGESAASDPVNTQNAKTTSPETSSLKPTKQKPETETPPGVSTKEGSDEPSGDQDDDDTPLDDKRLPRTLFVGNVPHTANRKDLRKIFAKFGTIESIRIRNVIPDNPKIPKKAALLAQRLAKFSNSFSAYVVFKEVPEINKVLQNAVNGTNMTIFQEHHLRVTKALQTKGKRRLSVFIGNLPFDCSDEELITTFMPIAQECGVNLLNVRVTRDKDTGVGRGVGFATFDDMLAIQACMNKAGEIKLRGRVLRIERAFKEKMMKSKTYKRKQKAKFGRKK